MWAAEVEKEGTYHTVSSYLFQSPVVWVGMIAWSPLKPRQCKRFSEDDTCSLMCRLDTKSCWSIRSYHSVREYRKMTAVGPVVLIVRSIWIKHMPMTELHLVHLSPNQPNICYSVVKVSQEFNRVFQWLIAELCEKRHSLDQVLVYCQSITVCTHLHCTWDATLLFARNNGNYWIWLQLNSFDCKVVI